MSGSVRHPEEEVLEEYASLRTSRPDIEEHLRNCPECRSTVRALQSVGKALRALPREYPGKHLTEAVLRRAGIDPGSPKLDAMLAILAGTFCLLFLSAMVLGVFLLTGVVSLDDVHAGPAVVEQQWLAGWAAFSGWVGARLDRLAQLLPSATHGRAAVAACLVVAALLLVDVVLGRRIVRGRHES